MATLEEIYDSILRDDAEKEAFTEACESSEGVASLLSARGCNATVEELSAFLADKGTQAGNVAEDDLADAAAGVSNASTPSSLSSLGTCFTLSLTLKPKLPNESILTC